MIKDVYLHQHDDFLDLESGDVVFDVGAHIGSFALKAARLVGEDGIVVALEPELENYKLLEETIKLNILENIVPLPIALSDFQGPGKLSLAAGTVAQATIATMTLDPNEGEETFIELSKCKHRPHFA